MNTPTTRPSYPITFNLKADGWGGDVSVVVRARPGKTATVSISGEERIGFSFERKHWDRLRASFLAVRLLQKMRERGDPELEIEAAAIAAGAELRRPAYRLPKWALNLFDLEEKWSSLRVPGSEGTMYIGLCNDCKTVALSYYWRSTILDRPRFSAMNLTALIEHVTFAAEHAKTIIETQ